jgi:integrase
MNSAKIIQMPGVEPAKKKEKKKRNAMPDGRKRVRLTVEEPDGRKWQKAFYGKSIKEAEQNRDDWVEAQRLAKLPPPPPQPTVGAWIDEWLAVYGQNAGHSTNATTRYNCDKISKAIGTSRISDVKEADIQRIANTYTDRSKSFVTKLRVTTNAIFSRAVSNHLIEKDPCRGVKWAHGGEGTHRALEDWELQHIAQHWPEHRAGIWAMIMLYAGLRRGELAALRWSDIHADDGYIRVRAGAHFVGNAAVIGSTKTEAGVRDVPIFPPLASALEQVPLPPISPYVCCAVDGGALTLSAWVRAWDGYLVAMTNLLNNEPAYRPGRRSDKDTGPRAQFSVRAHDLRHSFCTMLYDAGVDLKTAQDLMGHSDAKMTMKIYTHLTNSKKKDSVEKMIEYTREK